MSTASPAAVRNALNWFEIAVGDIAAARTFYSAILNAPLGEPSSCGEGSMVLLPGNVEEGVGGSLTQSPQLKPGAGGTLVYLNVEGDLDGVVSRIPAAGGKVIVARKAIPPHGFIAIFSDPEGNVVGLHSLT
ncbi:glyoxalase [Verrucomicrobia bacterium LW23]|nr:glyoxalase [Verrucomicrobia bacterium LW23]